MSFVIKMGRRQLHVPRDVEAGGPEAIGRWMEEQTEKPKKKARTRKPRSRSKAPAPQATASEERDS
jgi:hypothetical protein